MPLAAVMTAPNELVKVQQLPDPILEKGGIIIETLYSEVCGTDVHLLRGHLEGVPYPIIPIAVKEGLNITRNGGRYVIVGHYTNTGDILINPHLEINLKHIDIRGTWGIDFSHFYRMIELLKRHSDPRKNIAWESIISRSYTLQEINQALADVEQGLVLKAVIQPNMS